MSEERLIRRDRMRFTKNTASSRLALLAILLNVLFFVSIYKVNNSAYYKWLIGVSILYNLVFMLAAFLASEGAKNYNNKYSFLMIGLGIGQIVRIFVYPAIMHVMHYSDTVITYKPKRRGGGMQEVIEKIDKIVMPPDQFTRVVIYLSLSALCLLAAAAINWYKCRELQAYTAASDIKQA